MRRFSKKLTVLATLLAWLLVTLLGNASAAAATAVSGFAVAPASAATGARTSYTLTFVVTTALSTANHDTVTVTFPSDTAVPNSLAAADITVQNTTAAGAAVLLTTPPTVAGQSVTLSVPVNIAAGNHVSIILANNGAGHSLTNPTTSGNYNATIWTAQDAATVQTAAPYAIATSVGAFAKLQVLLPGETAAPGTASGKTGSPSSVVAGQTLTVTVNAVDANWNPVGGVSDSVSLNASDPLFAGLTFSLVNGTGSQVIQLRTAGASQWVRAADVNNGSISANTSSNVAVAPAAAALLAVSAPGSVAQNSAFTLTVTAKDPYGNIATGYAGSVHFSTSDPNPTLPPDYTFTTGAGNDNGVHAFSSLVLRSNGSQTITVRDAANGLQQTANLTVGSSAVVAATLQVIPGASVVSAGNALAITVTAKDLSGNVATVYNGVVHFTSTDAAANLPADYTFTGADAGQHVFYLTLNTPGSQVVIVSDRSNASVSGNSGSINVLVSGGGGGAGGAVNFTATAASNSASTGSALALTVTARDGAGNRATAYAGTVHFSSSDPLATLPADYSFVPGVDAGQHVFSVVFNTVGTWTVSVRDAVNNLNGISGTVSTSTSGGGGGGGGSGTPLVVHGFQMTPVGGLVQAGTVITASATAVDNAGNINAGYRGTVHLSSTDANATMPADYTYSAADNGVHYFQLTLATNGNQVITVADRNNANLYGTSGSLQVFGGVAGGGGGGGGGTTPVSVSVSGPAQVAAGGTATYTATAYNSQNTAVNATFTWSASGGSVAQNGQWAAPTAIGTYTISAAASGVTGSQVVAVTHGAAVSLSLNIPGQTLTLGQTLPLTYTATDAYGNPITDCSPLWSVSGVGSIAGNAYLASAVGSAVINLSACGRTASSGPITVLASGGGNASSIVLSGPTQVTAGSNATYTATAYNAQGNVVSTTFAWGATGGNMLGGGNWLAPTAAGNYTISATAGGASGSLAVTVTHGTINSLTVTVPAQTISIGQLMPLTYQATDAYGNPITDCSAVWSVSGVGNVTGTSFVSYVAGSAVLTVTACGRSAGSGTITVTGSGSGLRNTILINPASATLNLGGQQQFTATVYDANGNISGAAVNWTANGGSISSNGTYTADGAAMVATVTATASSGGMLLTGSASVTIGGGGNQGQARVVVSGPTQTTPGSTAVYTAQAYNAAGNPVGSACTWSADGGNMQSGGVWLAPSTAGSYSVTASCGGITGSLPVTVQHGSINSLLVTVPGGSVAVGQSLPLTYSATDAYGTPITDCSAVWSVVGVGQISGSNFVSYTVGTATLTVTACGRTASSGVITVAGATLRSVSLTPATANVPAGGMVQFVAQAMDATGQPISNVSVAWNATGGYINPNGLFTAGQLAVSATITATVTAGSSQQTATATVFITAADTGGGGTPLVCIPASQATAASHGFTSESVSTPTPSGAVVIGKPGVPDGTGTVDVWYSFSQCVVPDSSLLVYYYYQPKNQWVAVGTPVGFNVATGDVPAGVPVALLMDPTVRQPDDTTAHWANPYILKLLSYHLANGFPDGHFHPNDPVSRYEIAKLLAIGTNQNVSNPDMSQLYKLADAGQVPDWARNYVAAVLNAGLMKGTGSGFNGYASLTRAEMAAIIGRILTSDVVPLRFADNTKIPVWARDGVARAVSAGIIKGYEDNTFRPDSQLTRGEAAKIITLLFNM